MPYALSQPSRNFGWLYYFLRRKDSYYIAQRFVGKGQAKSYLEAFREVVRSLEILSD